jgi:hypothetical protein
MRRKTHWEKTVMNLFDIVARIILVSVRSSSSIFLLNTKLGNYCSATPLLANFKLVALSGTFSG